MEEAHKRKGDWIQTFTAVAFWPIDPNIEEINIYDIAHSLANQCRFTGHCKFHYSIAQHSIYCAEQCKRNKFYALLHDASEAYLVDIPRPLKHLDEFKTYRLLEAQLQGIICDKFGLDRAQPADVTIADNRMLATEARDLMKPPLTHWNTMPAPYDFTIECWTPDQAEERFLEVFDRLSKHTISSKK
jgi:hypothetical protein